MAFPFFTLEDAARSFPGAVPPVKLAVLGDPVAHSRSPQLHNPALRARGFDAQYVRLAVPPARFREALARCREAGLAGVNCTIPHKFAALEVADDVDPPARRLGAVNTLVFRDDGRLAGFNTDGPGLQRALEETFAIPLAGLRVLVLGAGGGAGRAAAVQCALAGCARLILVNRTREKIEALATELTVGADALLPAARLTLQATPDLCEADLVINATSVGMKPDDPTLVDPAQWEPRHLAYDMIYSPPETPLLAAARAAGAHVGNGLSMLLHQGAASFAHWFGDPVPLEEMRRGLQESFTSQAED